MNLDKFIPVIIVSAVAIVLIVNAKREAVAANRSLTHSNSPSNLVLWIWLFRATGVSMLLVVTFVVVLFRYWE